MAEPAPLLTAYGSVLFDCDGVVYLGDEVIPAAVTAVDGVRRQGVRVAFVTNNSSVAPDKVAAKLTRLGIDAGPGDVVTSAQAVVRLLGGPDALKGARVLVVGGPGLRAELTGAGAEIVEPARWRDTDIVVVGLDRELTYERLSGASLALANGARFAGTNADRSLPEPDGPLPGAGSLLALLTLTTGRVPEVAGKPAPALFETAATALGAPPYLMVGDRADTDLDGAHRLGWSTALVLSGVTRPADLPDLAIVPDHLLPDVGGLLDPPGPAVRPAGRADRAAADRLLGVGGEDGERRLVAVDDERVVGAVAVRCVGTDGQLDGPVVDHAWRGRLVGTRLVVAACIRARADGLVRVTAPRAGEAFLARLGFRPAGDGASMVREL
ncbi:MAG: HAD-IIA family hydrolase [Actinomycetes bacterium]